MSQSLNCPGLWHKPESKLTLTLEYAYSQNSMREPGFSLFLLSSARGLIMDGNLSYGQRSQDSSEAELQFLSQK